MFNFMRLPPLRRLMLMKAITGGGTWSTVTGNPVSFPAKAAPLKQLSVAFSPVQEGTGDPSPDNVRPILGWDSLNVWQTGKNLLDPAKKVQSAHTVARWYQADGFLLRAGKSYTLSSDTQGTTVYFMNKETDATIKSGLTATYTPTADVLVYFTAYLSTGINLVNLQLELGTTATEYVPYNGRTISITLGSTVYSGTVDVVTGVWEIDRTDIVFDGSSDENWSLYTFGSAEVKSFRIFVSDMKNADVQNYIAAEWLRNQTAGWANLAEWTISVAARYFYCRADSTIVTVEAWKAYLAEHPLKATYPLATPVTIQLTPQEINSLAGDNTMWSDAASLEVTYRSN